MKKLALMFAAAVAGVSMALAKPSYVVFSSEGPDKYEDGTIVLDGEIYALVWTPNAEFGGLDAAGEPVVSGDKVIGMAATAKGGRCTPVVYMFDDNEISGGNFFVYLLDTRMKSVAADGTTVITVAGLTAEGKLTVVNAVQSIAEPVAGLSTTAAADTVDGSGSVATAVPADAPVPRITAIKVVGAKVVVTVVDTLPCLQYGITAGKTPAALDQKNLIDCLNGVEGGEIKLVIDNPAENRFFKVDIRK